MFYRVSRAEVWPEEVIFKNVLQGVALWGIPPNPIFLTFFGAKKEAKKHPPPPTPPPLWGGCN